MNTEQLGEVLARAAAPVPRPDFARTALEQATAVRRKRAAVTATVAAAAMVVAVTVGVSLGGGTTTDGPVAPPSSITSGVPGFFDATPPPIDESVVQPRWDPREVGSLPTVDIGLPASLAPPADAEPLVAMEAAVALVDDQERLFVVDASGTWASLSYPEPPVAQYMDPAVLTLDGSRVLYAGRTALWSRDVRGGEWESLAYPDRFTELAGYGVQLVPDGPDSLWMGRGMRDRTWYVDLAAGSIVERDVALETATWAAGRGLVRIGLTARPDQNRYLTVGTPGVDEQVWRTYGLGALTGLAADGESLAASRGVGGWSGNRGPTEQNGLIALRLSDLSARAYLPFPDPNYWYTDAGTMAALSWLDPDTVLVSVLPQDSGGYVTGTRYLFTWSVETGDLRLVAEFPAGFGLSVAREGRGQTS